MCGRFAPYNAYPKLARWLGVVVGWEVQSLRLVSTIVGQDQFADAPLRPDIET